MEWGIALKQKKKSLHKQIWIFFLLFSLFILVFLWLFQGLFFDKYYELHRGKELSTIASKIADNYNKEGFNEYLDSLSYDEGICIEVESFGESLYRSMSFNRGCMVGKGKDTYKADFVSSNEDKKSYKIINTKFNNETLVYGIRLDHSIFAYVSISLEPLDSATHLLKQQLIILSILVLGLSILAAYFLSKVISRPIEEMSKKASKIAKGNFKDSFTSDTDIEEIQELENSLNSMRDEFNKTEELRRDLMANVSHDLKTPLTMIKAYAEMVRDLTYKNKEKRNENLNVIIDESERLNLLVEDILALSSMQADTIQLEYTSFSLDEMVKSIIKRYDVLLEKEDYHFLYDQKRVFVYADKKRTEQVIYNILNNAINYTGEDKKVFITIEEKENTVRISIRDTGKGIKEEDIHKIWDKYYHSSKKHKRNKVGTGLGLSIVKTILEEYKLPYGVESKENFGTTFYFELEKAKEIKSKES